ncbi:TolB family protein [Nonomuraea lactucae]|uniref:TolB family protein n=1 Tax=Nonomuraea lactucae TaxID=2249762 RepID=UPI000DE4A351|nr:PD40 domain-containing protein [Nonomuraea lactucae]
MRHPSASAPLLLAAVLGGLGTVPAAHASTGPPAARAAWIKSCTDKKTDTARPCGHWRLVMRDGRTLAVRDAAVTRVGGNGERTREEGRFAVSGDGRVIAYERAGDHRIVVRRAAGGPVTVLPESLVPKDAGTEGIAFQLSPSGDRVMVDRLDDAAVMPTKVVTVATGRIVRFPGRDEHPSFSADGDEILARRHHRDNTTSMVAHRLGGGSTRRTPPQVVANAANEALAADGRTVALFVAGNADRGKAPRLRIYDLETGELSAGVDLALKPDAEPSHMSWTAGGALTATFVPRDEHGGSAVVRVLTVDVGSGAVTRADAYSASRTAYAYHVAGE